MTEAAVTAPASPAEASDGVEAAREEVVVLDYGGQYSQLIARRIRDCGVFSELLPHHVPLEEITKRYGGTEKPSDEDQETAVVGVVSVVGEGAGGGSGV